MKQRFVRPGDELSDETVIVVRGGTLADEDALDDALAAFEVYGVYALSVFALVDTTIDELAPRQACEHRTVVNPYYVR